MNPVICQEACSSPASYQCAKDGKLLCSLHCRLNHLRHKFFNIQTELARRKLVANRLLEDLDTLQGSGSMRERLVSRREKEAEIAAGTFVETFEDLVDLHKRQLSAFSRLAECENPPEIYEILLRRLKSDFVRPLVRYEIVLSSDSES